MGASSAMTRRTADPILAWGQSGSAGEEQASCSSGSLSPLDARIGGPGDVFQAEGAADGVQGGGAVLAVGRWL